MQSLAGARVAFAPKGYFARPEGLAPKDCASTRTDLSLRESDGPVDP